MRSISTFGIMRSMLAWVWKSRLTWRAAFVVSVAGGLAILGGAGLPGAFGTGVLMVSLVGWIFLLARMADNEVRHAAERASAAGRPLPARKLRRLLFPWWGRAALGLGVLAVSLAAIPGFDDRSTALVYVGGLVVALAVERTVIAVRSRSAVTRS